jgi:hypothetical protein
MFYPVKPTPTRRGKPEGKAKEQHMKRNIAIETRSTENAKSLRELGVPGNLAAEFEVAFRLLGHSSNGVISGFTFVTPDGKRHALREENAAPLARAA